MVQVNNGFPLVLRASEVARLLNVSLRTIQRLTKNGAIPHVKLGGGRRPLVVYPRTVIESLLKPSDKTSEPA
jgi:excisionase family DNA binding protein